MDEFLTFLNNYQTLIPLPFVNHYLKQSGCRITDPNALRMVALATQKMMCDIVIETKTRSYGRTSQSTGEFKQSSFKRSRMNESIDDLSFKNEKLTYDDLQRSLINKGIITDVPPFYISSKLG